MLYNESMKPCESFSTSLSLRRPWIQNLAKLGSFSASSSLSPRRQNFVVKNAGISILEIENGG